MYISHCVTAKAERESEIKPERWRKIKSNQHCAIVRWALYFSIKHFGRKSLRFVFENKKMKTHTQCGKCVCGPAVSVRLFTQQNIRMASRPPYFQCVVCVCVCVCSSKYIQFEWVACVCVCVKVIITNENFMKMETSKINIFYDVERNIYLSIYTCVKCNS